MTFPQDQIGDLRRIEDHSLKSVLIVSAGMIIAALAGLSFVIP